MVRWMVLVMIFWQSQITSRVHRERRGMPSAEGVPRRFRLAAPEPHKSAMIVNKKGIICRKNTRL